MPTLAATRGDDGRGPKCEPEGVHDRELQAFDALEEDREDSRRIVEDDTQQLNPLLSTQSHTYASSSRSPPRVAASADLPSLFPVPSPSRGPSHDSGVDGWMPLKMRRGKTRRWSLDKTQGGGENGVEEGQEEMKAATSFGKAVPLAKVLAEEEGGGEEGREGTREETRGEGENRRSMRRERAVSESDKEGKRTRRERERETRREDRLETACSPSTVTPCIGTVTLRSTRAPHITLSPGQGPIHQYPDRGGSLAAYLGPPLRASSSLAPSPPSSSATPHPPAGTWRQERWRRERGKKGAGMGRRGQVARAVRDNLVERVTGQRALASTVGGEQGGREGGREGEGKGQRKGAREIAR